MERSPPLETRSASDLIDEGRKLAEQYLREWPPQERDDPGHALLSSFAGMKERLFEQLNRYGEKVFLELLAILGLELRLPTAARTLLTFKAVTGLRDGTWIPTGTSVQAEGAPGRPRVSFRTEEDLYVSRARLAAVAARSGLDLRPLPELLGPSPSAKPVEPFSGMQRLEDWLYLSDPLLDDLVRAANPAIILATDLPVPPALADRFRWEYHDGEAWRGLPLLPARDALYLRSPDFARLREDGRLLLNLFSGLQGGRAGDYLAWEIWDAAKERWRELKTEAFEAPFWPGEQGVALLGPVEDLEPEKRFGEEAPGYWLRARILEMPFCPFAPLLYKVSVGSDARQAPVPEAYCGPADGTAPTVRLETTAPFLPFGKAPAKEMAVYLLLDDLSAEQRRVQIDVQLDTGHLCRPSPDLVVHAEYFDGTGWPPLGRTTRFGVTGTYRPHWFVDETRALSRSGTIGFSRPADIQPCYVEQTSGHWVRLRISSGHYGREKGQAGAPRVLSMRCRVDRIPEAVTRAVLVRNFTAADITDKLSVGKPDPWPGELEGHGAVFAFAGPVALARPEAPEKAGAAPAPREVVAEGLPKIPLPFPAEPPPPDQAEEPPRSWIRVRLPHSERRIEASSVKVRSQTGWEGRRPVALLTSSDGVRFVEPGADEPFAPFGLAPAVDGCFYVDLGPGATPGSQLVLRFIRETAGRGRAGADLRLAFEVFDAVEQEWTAAARAETAWFSGGMDTTERLTGPGRVQITLPPVFSPASVRGRKGHWIRVRIALGDYSIPPGFEGLRLDIVPPARPVERVVTVREQSAEAWADRLAEGGRMPLLVPPHEEDPAVEVAILPVPPKERMQIYALVEERLGRLAERRTAEFFDRGREGEAVERPRDDTQQPVWEYRAPGGYRPLNPRDDTRFLARSGMVSFVPPEDWQKELRYGRVAYWLRLRLPWRREAEVAPLLALLSDTVAATHSKVIARDVLGGGEAEPNQVLKLLAAPVLDGPTLMVREDIRSAGPEAPPDDDDDEAPAVRETRDEDGKLIERWVRWKAVPNLLESEANDRHYVVDRQDGRIRFGDGRHGRLPPVGRDTVAAERYRTGGGAAGNVAALSINQPEEPLPGIERVFNPIAAQGGSETGRLDEVAVRGPELLRNRERVVTAEDCAWLVPLAFPAVSRVLCQTRAEESGLVDIFVLPRVEGADPTPESAPKTSPELLRAVREYVEARRQPGSRIAVSGPRFVEFDLKAVVVLGEGSDDEEAHDRLAQAAHRWFDPWQGGPEGKGWPFGREVKLVDALRAIRGVPGIAAIYGGDLVDRRTGKKCEAIALAEPELARLVRVDIVRA